MHVPARRVGVKEWEREGRRQDEGRAGAGPAGGVRVKRRAEETRVRMT